MWHWELYISCDVNCFSLVPLWTHNWCMTWAHSGSSDSHFKEFRAASFEAAFFAHAVEDANLDFGKRRNKHVLGCEGQISPGCMDVCLMQCLCRGNVLTYSDPIKAGHHVLCERQHRLDKKLEVCSSGCLPHKGVDHCAALQSHSNISLGKWLSLGTSVRRVYSLLCWGLYSVTTWASAHWWC